MARGFYVLALIAVASCLVPIQGTSDNVCDYNCVVDVYSANCGGTTCVSNAQPGMEQQICNNRCIDALAGAPLTSCLSILPPFQNRAAELAGTISTNVESFCISVGFPITDAAPPTADGPDATLTPTGPSTGPATSVVDGPATVEDSPEVSAESVPLTADPPVVIAPVAETPSIDTETPTVEAETPEAVEPEVDAVPSPSETGPIETPEETPEEPDVAPAETPDILPPAPAPETAAPTPDLEDEEAVPSSLPGYDFDEMEEDSMLKFLLDV